MLSLQFLNCHLLLWQENTLSVIGMHKFLQCFHAKSFHRYFAVRNIAYNEIVFVE